MPRPEQLDEFAALDGKRTCNEVRFAVYAVEQEDRRRIANDALESKQLRYDSLYERCEKAYQKRRELEQQIKNLEIDLACYRGEVKHLKARETAYEARIEKALDRIVMRGEGSGPCDKLAEDVRSILRGEGA